jgi:predicted TIM-barrel fold metal-dependent hydrolase
VLADRVVVDAVVHPFNVGPENQAPGAEAQLEALYGAHRIAFGDRYSDYVLSRDEFFSDFSYEAIAHALFVESTVDFGIVHALPNLGFARTHVTRPDRVAALCDKYPDRFLMYATVDTPLTDTAIEELEKQVAQYPVHGLKLYPAFFYDGKGEGWRLDGPDFATPLLEAARDLGIRNIAIHKGLWLAPAPREAFGIDDLATALERFPDMTFQIVHAGTAFFQQTVELLRDHPNMFATLETTFQYLISKPALFGRIIGTMLTTCGSEQLLFASGVDLMHPEPLLREFDNYQIPESVLDEYDLRQITDDDRRNILGRNALRLHGLTEDAVIARIAGDDFSRAREMGEETQPWHAVRMGALR